MPSHAGNDTREQAGGAFRERQPVQIAEQWRNVVILNDPNTTAVLLHLARTGVYEVADGVDRECRAAVVQSGQYHR
jgi:hypothetical protein